MIGHKIKRLRMQKGLTQQQLIDGLFDRSYISIIERGKVVPPVETLEILAQRLDVPLAELTNYSEAVMRARELLKVARKTQDINILREVWEICVGVDAIEVMIECVLAWSDVQLGNANEYIELLEALNQTIYAMISVDEDFAEMTTLQFRRANTYYHLRMTDQAIIAYRALESQSISTRISTIVSS
ncbi:helix-turn-helix domain-containing protein (plasmid) [Alicyclobacillus acidoterrestris]|uniref:helix-turn-helix domain-containing protein n=1 Tax=Alicyclobacillus acidoterrestris TaxID=1450 RepID=UPI003F53249A